MIRSTQTVVMSTTEDLIEKLENLALDDEKKKNRLQVYLTRLLFSKENFLCEAGGYIVIKDYSGRNFVTLQRKLDREKNIVLFCTKCDDERITLSDCQSDDVIKNYCEFF